MDFVLEIPNNLSKEICEDIIKRFEKDSRSSRGVVGIDGSIRPIKKSLDLMISAYQKEWSDIDEYLHKQLGKGIEKYKEHLKKIGVGYALAHVLDGGAINDTGYQVQKTVQGEFYSWHSDSCAKDGRFLTFLWYLTTHDNIQEGGQTGFHQCVGDGGKLVVPEQGKLLIFPATWTYLHSGLAFAPTDENNIKYICTGWLHSPNT